MLFLFVSASYNMKEDGECICPSSLLAFFFSLFRVNPKPFFCIRDGESPEQAAILGLYGGTG